MFGCNGIQGYVPCLPVQCGLLLEGVGKAAQLWTSVVAMPAFEGKGAVIEAPTHTQACTTMVKRHQWHNCQIQPACCPAVRRYGDGFEDAEAVEAQRGMPVPAYEPQGIGMGGGKYWQVKSLVWQCPTQQRLRVGLPAYWQVNGYVFGIAEGTLSPQMAGCLLGPGSLLLGG